MKQSSGRGRRMPSIRTAGIGILGVLALVFVFQNSERRRVHFLAWHLTMPAWIWLLVVFGVGVLVGTVLPRLQARSRKA